MKRLNPNTGEPFKRGDVRDDGFIFESYNRTKTTKEGHFYEAWRNPDKFPDRVIATAKRRRKNEETKDGHLTCFLRSVKKRAKEKNLSFDLDKDYLRSIATDECPVFYTKFDWGIKGRGYSPQGPSLDRIIPELGYVKGNVVFISSQANNIKSNVTEKELYAVADWLHNKRKEVINAFKDRPTPVPAAPDTPGRRPSEHRALHGVWPRKECDSADNRYGEPGLEDAGDRAASSGRVSVGAGVPEMGSFEWVESVFSDRLSSTEIKSTIEQFRYLRDKRRERPLVGGELEAGNVSEPNCR